MEMSRNYITERERERERERNKVIKFIHVSLMFFLGYTDSAKKKITCCFRNCHTNENKSTLSHYVYLNIKFCILTVYPC